MGVIFISHSSKNNAEAVAVRDWLRAEGYGETFLDLDPEHDPIASDPDVRILRSVYKINKRRFGEDIPIHITIQTMDSI